MRAGAARALPRPRRLVRRARIVLCPSRALADDARKLGAREVLRRAERRRDPGLGRRARATAARPLRRPALAREGRRGAARGHRGMPRVIVGDGPLRDSVPGAVGFVAPCRARPGTTSARRSSCARRVARATGWSRARRWRMAGRWSQRRSAGSSMPWRTVSPARSSRHETRRRCDMRSRRCSGTRSSGGATGLAARDKARRELSWAAATHATIAAYRDALGGSGPES